MNIFHEGEMYLFLSGRVDRLRAEVEAENRDQFLNLNETKYVEYLADRYRLEPIVFDWNSLTAEPIEKEILKAKFPPTFDFMNRSGTAKRPGFRIRVPYRGDAQLLRFRPSTHRVWSIEVGDERTSEGGVISFDLINWSDGPEQIKSWLDEARTNLQFQEGNLRKDIEGFNASLESTARQGFEARKRRLLRDAEIAAAIGVPLFRSQDVPDTFKVPVTPRRLVAKPSAKADPYRPEKTISDDDHEFILKVLYETGVAMERTPATFSDAGEEALRDQFLMVLSTHFPNTTGETFNRSGKTDLLIRHEGNTLFVAECKFWNGPKSLSGAIDQLLGYLTWRDSKAAVLCFVRRKELQPVLEKVPEVAAGHPCVTRRVPESRLGCFRFEAHLKDDPGRPVRLSVLCFHFPEFTEGSTEPLAP